MEEIQREENRNVVKFSDTKSETDQNLNEQKQYQFQWQKKKKKIRANKVYSFKKRGKPIGSSVP